MVLLVGVVAACVGVGAGYLLFTSTAADETRTGRADLTAEEIDRVAAVIGDYEAAWNAYDADAIRDVLTEDFMLEGYTAEGTAAQLDNMLDDFVERDAQIQYLGDLLIVRNEGTASGGYNVSAMYAETVWFPQQMTWYGITDYRVAEDGDGLLKIHRANPSYLWFRY